MTIGSGATAGAAAKKLTKGIRIVLIKDGPKITPKDLTEITRPGGCRFRVTLPNRKTPGLVNNFGDACRATSHVVRQRRGEPLMTLVVGPASTLREGMQQTPRFRN